MVLFRVLFASLFLLLFSSLSAIENEELPFKLETLESKKYSQPRNLKKQKPSIHLSKSSNPNGLFFQTNIGVGFLYFSKVRGNFSATNNFSGGRPLNGTNRKISYNRSPIYEYLIGYQFFKHYFGALSYQTESFVDIQSPAYITDDLGGNFRHTFTSNLSLNGLMLKIGASLPYSLHLKEWTLTPYLGIGVGAGWQTWSQIQALTVSATNYASGSIFVTRQKNCANAVWMIDTAFKLSNSSSQSPFNIYMGCKYNAWGQARNLGKNTQQGNQNDGFRKPVKIKLVYQFAPYLGLSWIYPMMPRTSARRSQNSWKPHFCSAKEVLNTAAFVTQFSAGIGFLYFSGLRGNITGNPPVFFDPGSMREATLKGKLRYNRTPLFEYQLGYRFSFPLKLVLSYLYQSNIEVSTIFINAMGTETEPSYNPYRAQLSLNALLIKSYFEIPYSMVVKNTSINPFLGAGIGPGWQTWTALEVLLSGSTPLNLRQKVSANAVFTVDAGLSMQRTERRAPALIRVGCQYNQWGQARSMGKLSQQNTVKRAIAQPVRIKTVYQFAPYIAFLMNFANPKSLFPKYKLEKRSPDTWKPYWVKTCSFQANSVLFAQFNVGVGFLYFKNVRGNLIGLPAEYFDDYTEGLINFSLPQHLSYNRTPLFEYNLGYQGFYWLKPSLCFQHQAGVVIKTPDIPNPPEFTGSEGAEFNYSNYSAHLSLNALFLKIMFELPYSWVFKNLAFSPYYAAGVGPGWQSWTMNQTEYIDVGSVGGAPYSNSPLLFRQKISANAVWMQDAGLRIQSAYPNSPFSVMMGCKYNAWGQARSIGKLSQQDSFPIGLKNPIIIKKVYQFAPYIGAQWKF